MEAGFHADLEIRTAAAVTVYAGIEAAAVNIVVVADQTIDHRVFLVNEIQRQRLGSRQYWFTQRNSGAGHNQRAKQQRRRGRG